MVHKKEKKDLEETIKEKVSPLLKETIEKNVGVSIPKLGVDITDKLTQSHLDIYVPANLNFKDAKKMFKKEFLRMELGFHLGNISQVAKSIDIDRRSVHRAIKEFGINVEEVLSKSESKHDYYQGIIGKKIKSTLEDYKGIIHPGKIELMYGKVSDLSKNIAKFLPHQDLSWKEAERGFEKQFLSDAIKKNDGNISKTAKIVGLRVETLHRKAKKLGLKKK
jgi:DNA-binding NtrC family response regulator